MIKNNIKITVKVTPIEAQTLPFKSQYAFAYTITISNQGQIGSRLISRHWLIQDETGYTEEVIGEGVVGEQPHLLPNEAFEYTSGAMIKTPTGTMKGKYHMISDTGENFSVEIAEFVLSKPYTLQ
ncbi:Co2+/Mg2+ efflux protein ApaG [bacterium endosymbiont of Bathymodiolus sp. 5 South]|jgi:ApaG protein|uniref:Co2+/Mg2+ efflux protein ApaG n=1 Tax=bacterium endosymbiont of Bathymodiolus sp. 5 South TaxID=1181670 RepID=UPI0010B03CB5|nr:Co2+/Mg2+ efflux protein ApaG [bacterium endosymbiont of Bathymodiolus sp. 5 South]CAC9639847.1 ApaG protein [uncultured Gammaproteobacteria bacterium]CAC9658595.1 ApaG protein [uncultured Gammaproteobacteria bacterium]SHN90017.1 ApaG protein [bacterium endosymbiont of Bathymodiolus sp. 5 South]SSC08438.1 ApaG protein [bacterium endosymbiont of Bathymodiolus sp. 5 South]VVH59559.1 ApaG protein [uncultured Gammaproteobacteria bacterium]